MAGKREKPEDIVLKLRQVEVLQRGARHRMEGTAADVPTLSPPGRVGEETGGRHHGDRPRDGRLHLGHRRNGDTCACTRAPR